MVEVNYDDGCAFIVDKKGNELGLFEYSMPNKQRMIVTAMQPGVIMHSDTVVELVAILNHWLDTGRIEARNG